MTDKHNNEAYVHDLTRLEVNFIDADGNEVLIIKPRYDTFIVVRNGYGCDYGCETKKISRTDMKNNYTPLLTATPRKWVTLTTVDGREVQCEFVATHESEKFGGKVMLLSDNPHNDWIIMTEQGSVEFYTAKWFKRRYTPIAPKPTAVEMIDSIICKSIGTSKFTAALRELKAVIQEGKE